MMLTMLKAKLHGATASDVNVDYEGSITIPVDLLDAVGILIHERVEVYDITNGARFATYAIAGPRGSGAVVVNGAAARLVATGDRLIIAAYCDVTPDEARSHVPLIARLGPGNAILPAEPPP